MADSNTQRRGWIPPMPDASKYIRLLKLPERFEDGDRIVLHLDTFLLADLPCYYAISYTWYDPFRGEGEIPTITCNDHEIPVRGNLYDALQEITRQFPGILLWNDALCIDQKDDTEVLPQVQLMGQIYQGAEIVLIWLGAAFPPIPDLYELYKGFNGSGAMRASQETQQREGSSSRDLIAPEMRMHSLLGARAFDPEKCWFGAWCFMNSWWFHRMWTFQEGILGRQAIFLFGPYQFKLNAIFDMIQAMSQPKMLHHILSDNWDVDYIQGRRAEYLSRIRSIYGIREFLGLPLGEDSNVTAYLDHICGNRSFVAILMFLIAESSGRSCEKHEDRINSLLGLCQVMAQHTGAAGVGVFFPDLESEVSTGTPWLIAGTARLLTIPFLVVLSYARMHRDRGRKASLEPSWMLPRDAQYEKHLTLLARGYDHEQPHYDASLARRRQVFERRLRTVIRVPIKTASRSLYGLRVCGSRVGRVRRIVSPEDGDYSKRSSPEANRLIGWYVLKALLDLLQEVPMEVYPGIASHEALWRTLIANTGANSCFPAPNSYQNYFRRWAFETLETKRQVEQDWADGKNMGVTMGSLKSLFSNAAEDMVMFHEMAEAFQRSSFSNQDRAGAREFWHQVLFPGKSLVLVNNNMIGLGTPYTVLGDEIWIIDGAAVPFILRESIEPGHYLLMGEAYVHGIMQGEFMHQQGDYVEWQEVLLV